MNRKFKIFFISLTLIILAATAIASCVKEDPIYDTYRNSSLNTLYSKGLEFLYDNKADSALLYFSLVGCKYTPDAPDSVKSVCADAYNNLGYTYFFLKNDFASSFTSLLKALDIAEEAHHSQLYPLIYLNIANIYLNYKDEKRISEYYKKAFNSSLSTHNLDILMIVMSEMSTHALTTGKIDLYSEEMNVFDTLDIDGMEGARSTKLLVDAVRAVSHRDTTDAIRNIRMAGDYAEIALTSDRFQWLCEAMAAHLINKKGEFTTALTIYKQLMNKAADYPDIRLELTDHISSIYIERNRPDSAIKYSLLHKQISDSLYQRQQYGLIRDISSNRDIRILDTKIMLTDARMKEARAMMWWAITSAIVFLFLGIIIYVQYRNLKEKSRNLYLKNVETIEKDLTKIHHGASEPAESTDKNAKYTGSSLGDDSKDRLVVKRDVMNNSDGITSIDFTLERLAALVQSNTTYVSQVINESFGKNFNTLLGEARVKVACARLNDQVHFGNLTIEAIASGLGFKSRTNFVAVFKKATGLTPSEFRRIGRDEARKKHE